LFLLLNNNSLLHKWNIYSGLGFGVYNHTTASPLKHHGRVFHRDCSISLSGKGSGLGLSFWYNMFELMYKDNLGISEQQVYKILNYWVGCVNSSESIDSFLKSFSLKNMGWNYAVFNKLKVSFELFIDPRAFVSILKNHDYDYHLVEIKKLTKQWNVRELDVKLGCLLHSFIKLLLMIQVKCSNFSLVNCFNAFLICDNSGKLFMLLMVLKDYCEFGFVKSLGDIIIQRLQYKGFNMNYFGPDLGNLKYLAYLHQYEYSGWYQPI